MQSLKLQSLKRILIATGIFLVVVLVIGFMLPSTWQVQRSVVINAPVSAIFPYINNLKRWRDWAVWYQENPDMVVEYSGPDAGVGATSRWTDENGRGAMKIMQSTPNRGIEYQVLFNAGVTSLDGALTLIPEGANTRVVWEAGGVSGANPANRYFALMMRFWIGSDFAASLKRLKEKVEPKT